MEFDIKKLDFISGHVLKSNMDIKDAYKIYKKRTNNKINILIIGAGLNRLLNFMNQVMWNLQSLSELN